MTVLYQCGWMLCSPLVCFNTQSLISLCFTVVHRKPMLRYYVLKCHIYSYTVQCRAAGKSKAVALAPSTALRLASALCQLLTTLGNRWKVCPENVPQIFFFSNPLCRILYFWFMYCWLTPDAACLIGSTFGVLQQSSSSWCDCFIWSLLSSKHI